MLTPGAEVQSGAELSRITASISQQHLQVWCADIPKKVCLLLQDQILSQAHRAFHSWGPWNAFSPFVMHVAPSILHRSWGFTATHPCFSKLMIETGWISEALAPMPQAKDACPLGLIILPGLTLPP